MKRILEEILEAIWNADEKGDSSLDAIKKNCPDEIADDDMNILRDRNLVTIEADRVILTREGRNEARSVVRRHRLAESLFATILDLDAEKREKVACEVEHTLLPEVEEAICTLLGHPAVCPDGGLIPPGRCCASGRTTASSVAADLTRLNPGDRGRIAYIKPKHHDRLHRLTSLGLTPGTIVEVHQKYPVVCVRYEGTELALDQDVAEDIFVAKIE